MSAAAHAPQWPLVGREVERATAAAAIRSGQALVVWGPGGVGKTRLLRAIADDARADGWAVRPATGTASASGIPLGAVAHFVPAPLLDAARDQVLRAIVASIEESIADRDRLVLAVDDAHLLDDASATLIANLARAPSPRLAVVVAHRPGPNVPDAVEAIATGGGEQIELGPLDEPETAGLLEAGLGAPVDPVTVRLLVRWTRGNALFLRELVRDGIDRSVLRIEHDVWRWHGPPAMGPTLRQLIEARHRRLGDEALAALEVVAVGEPLARSAVAQLADERAIAELDEAGLLEWSDDGGRVGVRVSHPLHAEVLRSTIPATRARRVRQEIAAVLGGDGATSADRMRQAVLLAEAGVAADPDALVVAARRAWALRDTALVDRLARAARREGPHPEADYLLGETLADRGDYEGAVVAWSEILEGELAEPLRVRVAIAAAAVLALTLHRADEARLLLDRTEAQVGSPDGRARLEGSRAALFLSGPQTDGPAEVDADGGRGGAGRTVDRDGVDAVHDDVPGQARVFAWLGSAREWLLEGRTDAVLADAEEMAAVADRVSEELPMGEMFVGICHFFALVHGGRLDEAQAFSEARRERSLLDPLPIAPATWSQGLGIVALARGHLDVAATHLRAAAALLRGNDIGSLRHVLHELALASAQAADASGVAAALAEATTANSGLISPFVEDARVDGALLAARGDVSGARRVLRAAVDGRARPVAFYDIPAWHDLARYGATDEAAAALGSWAEVVDGPVARWCADQAAALGRRDADELEAVARRFEDHGYDLDAAETFAAAATMPLGRGGDAARRSADVARRAEAALARCGPVAPRTPMLASLGPMRALTAREREVASLAAEGRTDQDLAEHLGVSPRTVHAHLRSIYRKLEVSSRAELVDRLASPR